MSKVGCEAVLDKNDEGLLLQKGLLKCLGFGRRSCVDSLSEDIVKLSEKIMMISNVQIQSMAFLTLTTCMLFSCVCSQGKVHLKAG